MTEANQKPAPGRTSFTKRLLHSQELGIVGALLIMIAALSIFAPGFISPDNLLDDARNLSFLGIVVLGQTMVMITGGIDSAARDRTACGCRFFVLDQSMIFSAASHRSICSRAISSTR
jgi:predicted ABC-type sugar transport system permease subunit